jgi:hypothetical protein
MDALSVATIGVFVVLFTVVLAWSPLARGLVREAVARPNEPCTFTTTTDGGLEVHRNVLPSKSTDKTGTTMEEIGSSTHFKWVRAAVFAIKLFALLALLALVFAPDGPRTAAASGTCEKAFIFGFSALIGLIGGKASSS